MAVFKCKICGGTLQINDTTTVATCEYCGTRQTLPRLDDEKRVQLYDRANHFRRENEFDKAMGIYEMILSEDKNDCESYWGIVLCRYGIEYVEDPESHKRIPTVNRAQFTSIFDDRDYKNALKYADVLQKEIYEAEAETIDKIQRGILAISNQEDPFDIFICYKETDNSGNRTQDSVYAQDIYNTLIKEGYKVFFSKITLEDKLGSAYEPYIFAAINSAKVMLVVGTHRDNFNAVWVKNEWSRYLSLVKSGQNKTLIPVYKDISPYDMPEEFQFLQSQDMSKIGFMQDLLRGVEKIVGANKTAVKESVFVSSGNVQTEPLLKRAFMFLEDGDFARADEFCEQVLNLDPENARAYLGKLLVDLEVKKPEHLSDFHASFSDNNNYDKIMRFADKELRDSIKKYNDIIVIRNEEARVREIYENAIEIMENATTEEMFENAGYMFQEVKHYAEAKHKSDECFEKAEIARKDAVLSEAKEKMSAWDISYQLNAIELLESIPGWKDADGLVEVCRQNMVRIQAHKEERERIAQAQMAERQRQLEIAKKADEKKSKREKTVAICISLIIALVIIISIIAVVVTQPWRTGEMSETSYYSGLTANESVSASSGESVSVPYQLKRTTVSAGYSCTVAVRNDGLVSSTVYDGESDLYFGQCDVYDWQNIVEVSSGWYHTVGLKSDGTVISTDHMGGSSYYFGQTDVYTWRDITAVSAGWSHTVGLRSDGTVVATQYTGASEYYFGQSDVETWTDIVAIDAGDYYTVGLKSDGTCVATGYNETNQCNVDDWTDIVAVSAGDYNTVGVKADGTVVSTQFYTDENYGQCDVDDWTDIVAVSVGDCFTVGLKADGTCVATGQNDKGQCNVSEWRDIVAISAGHKHTVGLKSDGTIVSTGFDESGQCDVADFRGIRMPG